MDIFRRNKKPKTSTRGDSNVVEEFYLVHLDAVRGFTRDVDLRDQLVFDENKTKKKINLWWD